jgi:hypothetical protein
MSRIAVFVLVALVQNVDATVYGVLNVKGEAQFTSIDETTGAETMSKIEVPYEGLCQGLTAIDSKNGIAYIIGYNFTDRKPNLVGFDTTTGAVAVDIELPFGEMVFVGLGQGLDVDPNTGDVIAIGQKAGAKPGEVGHHYVIRIDFATKKMTNLATIKQDATNIAILGGQANTLDYVNQVEYVNIAVNNSGKVGINIFAIDLKTGIVTILPTDPSKGEMLLSMDYDTKTNRIYGFGPSVPSENSYFSSAEEYTSWLQLQKGSSSGGYLHGLAYMDIATKAFKTIGGIKGFGMMEGSIATLDPVSRIHYSMIQPIQPAPKTWVNSTDCASGPFPCKTGSTCCADPAAKDKKVGACYKVPSCSAIHDGSGINMTDPFRLVGVDIETAEVKTHPALCTFAMQDCPWSLDAAKALVGL